MLGVAFKEWAAVCRALADGTQTVILRKGGIAEAGGAFRPEHPRFWLYPTHFHEQQRAGLKPEFLPLIDAADRDRPPAGVLRLTHYAEVTAAFRLDSLDVALKLDPCHVWTEDTVRQRFQYRDPGLYLLALRVYRTEKPVETADRPEYAGCRSWVQLDNDFEERPGVPVMTEADWLDQLGAVGRLTKVKRWGW